MTKDIPAYTVGGGNPARIIKKRFDDEWIELLLQLKWWDFESYQLVYMLPLLCSSDLEMVKAQIRERLYRE